MTLHPSYSLLDLPLLEFPPQRHPGLHLGLWATGQSTGMFLFLAILTHGSFSPELFAELKFKKKKKNYQSLFFCQSLLTKLFHNFHRVSSLSIGGLVSFPSRPLGGEKRKSLANRRGSQSHLYP